MRLLNVQTLECHEFYEVDADTPKYAVASHRWVRDEEATLDDIRYRRNRERSGYRKVHSFAEYVKNNIADVDYVWVDTCCINQDSSAELSEAVNSMFKWYSNAEVCLAHLADVDERDDLKQSIWFRRGWTLQELLAPHIVVFLTKDWEVLGHKGGNRRSKSGISLDAGPPLEPAIANITRISESVLRDYTQSYSFGLQQKLSWMNGRETTRPEDMSYCLLGILNISMSVIYGEGKEKAQERLEAKINRDRDTINGIPTAQRATHDSYGEADLAKCLEGTRVDILNQIDDWTKRADSKRIFWLCGAAGTGKSTICRTVADRLRRADRLGASFFFKRGEGDRSSARLLFPTITRQLADKIYGFDALIAKALANDRRICEKSIQDQFEHLLLQPLLAQGWSTPSRAVIVLDALDECEKENEIKMILNLLAHESVPLRVFVTSRPELPVRLGFHKINGSLHQDIILEEVQTRTIEDDIRTYLHYRFQEIKGDRVYDPLPTDWPGEGNIEALVELAVPLFIFASTMCRYIGETDPKERLKEILQRGDNSLKGLDRIYLPILRRLITGKDQQEQENALTEFQELVGPIVVLADSLSGPSLSKLLEISNVHTRLTHLHSVLNIPKDPDRPIRPHHLSFRDFLIDPHGKGTHPFWIDKVQTHSMLAQRCIQRLQTLRLNLCKVSHPGLKRADMSEEKIAEFIAADIAYACRYWVHHLSQSRETLHDDDDVHIFLRSHFLHWLEALSWLRRLSTAVADIHTLQTLVIKGIHGIRLREFLEDARRFVLRNRHIVGLAPLQLYLSALAFAPSKSVVKRTFDRHLVNWLNPLPSVPLNWSAEIQTLEGHSDVVKSVAFSHDRRAVVLASVSSDCTVRLWDAVTGEATQMFKWNDGPIRAVAFSADGRVVASASSDRPVRLWDVATGRARWTLNGHDFPVTALAVSPSGRDVASALGDYTVRLLDVATGRETRTLKGHRGQVTGVAFSPSGQAVASASNDGTVRLWDVATGRETRTLEWLRTMVTAVAFSPDGRAVAMASLDKTVRVCDVATGKARWTLEGHIGDVKAVAFSPDGRTVASASKDNTVRLWDAATGDATQTLKGHSGFPDGRAVAAASWDWTMRLWDAATSRATRTLEGHRGAVMAVAFSPDGRAVASASLDKTVRLWDAATGEAIRTLKGHSDDVTAVAFSPDSRTVASASLDKTVRLWDAATGKTVHVFSPFVRELTFSKDGMSLETDWETLDVSRFSSSVPSGSTCVQSFRRRYGRRDEWITCVDQDFLWLPPERRGKCASHGNLLLINKISGAMSFFRFTLLVSTIENWDSAESLERLLGST